MYRVRTVVYVDRASAIRAGRAEYGYVGVEVNPSTLTPEEREALAKLRPLPKESCGALGLDDSLEYLDLTAYPDRTSDFNRPLDTVTDASSDSIRHLLHVWSDFDDEYQSDEQLWYQHRMSELLDADEDELLVWSPDEVLQLTEEANRFLAELTERQREAVGDPGFSENEAAVLVRLKHLAALGAERSEEWRQRARQQLEDFIRSAGDTIDKGRLDEGLLSEREMRDIMREWLFRPFASFHRLKRFSKSNFESASVEFRYRELVEVGRSTYAQILKLRATGESIEFARLNVEGAVSVIPMVLEALVDGDPNPALTRPLIRVGIRAGVLRFSRDFGIEEGRSDA